MPLFVLYLILTVEWGNCANCPPLEERTLGPLANPNYDRQVQDVRAASDIVAVIQEYVPLQRKGRGFWANCPFHKEKTPSFQVSPDKQIFKCFGCGEGGDVFSFVMKYDGVDFPEALRLLAARAGIRLEEKQRSPETERAKRTLFDVNEWAARTFHKWLTATQPGKAALDYLDRRKIGRETVKRLRLGYAPPGWDNLLREARRAGVADKMLLEAGLAVEREGGGGLYDRFRGRVMFPILDPQGRAVGFGGRVIGDGEPKYLNSPETAVYHKGQVLYLAERAKLAMRDAKRAIVVEGYLDAIVAHECGFENTVAVLGTSLTDDHARYLKRYVDEAVMVFDGDEAGVRSANRSLESFAREELEARVAVLPDGLDPCDCLQERGAEFFRQCLDGAADALAFRVRSAASPAGGTGLDQARAVDEAIELVAHMPNPVARSLALGRISQELALPVAALQERLERLALRPRRRESGAEPQMPRRDAEAELVQVMLNHPEVVAWVQRELDLDMLRGEAAHQAAAVIFHLAEDGVPATPAEVLARIEDAAPRELVGRVMETTVSYAEPAAWARDLVRTIRGRQLREEAQALQEDIRRATDEEEEELLRRYLERKRLAHGVGEADEPREQPATAPEPPPDAESEHAPAFGGPEEIIY